MSDQETGIPQLPLSVPGAFQDGGKVYVPTGKAWVVNVPADLIFRVTAAIITVMAFAMLFHMTVLKFQDTLDRHHEERQQQTLQQLQQLMQGPSAGPSKESAPDSEQPDYRLQRNSYTRGAMRVYLSARFRRQEEMRRYAGQLRAEAIEVVSAWHDIDSPSSDGFSGLDDQRRAWLAMLDLQQLSGTNVLAVFANSEPVVSTAEDRSVVTTYDFRGRHNVEFGTALALGKRLLLVGSPENSFYCLPDVEHFPAWPDALARILELRGTDAMTTREAAREAGTTVQQIGMWIREGRLPAAKHNGRYVIGRNDLDRAKAQHLRARADALTAINSGRLMPFKG
jgi:hypothetical protein